MVGLLLFGVFITAMFTVVIIYGVVFSSRASAVSRLKAYTKDEIKYTEIINVSNENKSERKLFSFLGMFGKVLPKKGYLSKKKKKLTQAAVLMKPEEFLGASLLSGVILEALFYIISKTLLLALIFGLIGFIMPDLIVGVKKSKRVSKINSQLPEALNIISNGLRAGFSFIQAIGIVIEEVQGPISEEFSKVLRDNALGKPLEEALTNMSERTDDEDLDMVITTLIIQRQVGGNLAEVLDSIAYTIRERVKIKNDVKTLTAQGRLSGIIVSLLPFALALGLSVINPGYLNVLFTTTMGRIMTAIGLILQLAGIFILKKLVDIKV